jgi:hypothetical protein
VFSSVQYSVGQADLELFFFLADMLPYQRIAANARITAHSCVVMHHYIVHIHMDIPAHGSHELYSSHGKQKQLACHIPEFRRRHIRRRQIHKHLFYPLSKIQASADTVVVMTVLSEVHIRDASYPRVISFYTHTFRPNHIHSGQNTVFSSLLLHTILARLFGMEIVVIPSL